MFLALSEFEGWCADGSGVIKAMSFIKNILNIIRWVVPIGLIGYTSYEMIKKVINPDEKDFMKHITNRIIAAVVVFFVPFIVSFVLKIISIGTGGDDGVSNDSLYECWKNA